MANFFSANTLPSARTLPGDNSGGDYPFQSQDSGEASPPGSSGFPKPRGSGLFGTPRVNSRGSPANFGYPAEASLKQDPFMTRVAGASPDGEMVYESNLAMDEMTPLKPGYEASSSSDSSKGIIMPAAIGMLIVTVISGFALGMSFSETGYRDGYEEGHLDGPVQKSGCSSLFYWLLLQFCLDLIITCLTCAMAMNPPGDIVGYFGCFGTLRLCVLSAGFHLLYFAGLQREFCDSFLITWSTIITWLGVCAMFVVGCYLACALLGLTLTPRKRQPAFDKTQQYTP